MANTTVTGASTIALTLTEDDSVVTAASSTGGPPATATTSANTAPSDDTLTVNAGASLITGASTAVSLNLAAAPAPAGNGGTGAASGATNPLTGAPSSTGVGTGIVITNNGTISTTGSRVIDVATGASSTATATGAEITLNNAGTIASSGGSTSSKGDLFRVAFDMPSGIVNVYNTGTMSAGVDSNDSQAVRLAFLYTAKSILIDNGIDASGNINTAAKMLTADADAIRAGGVDPGGTAANVGASVINNEGTISAHDQTAIATLNAVNGIDISSGQSVIVNNTGTTNSSGTLIGGIIRGDESGLGSDLANKSTSAAPVTFTQNYNVTNSGEITGYNGAGIASSISGAGTATIVNSGTIQGEATGNTDNDTLAPYGTTSTAKITNAAGVGVLVGGNVTITNNASGLIQGTGAIGSGSNGLTASFGVNAGGGTIVNNAGATIQDTAASGQAILFRDASGTTNTISNYGAIAAASAAGKAITFGAGNDTLNLYAGETLTGTVTAGAGTNTLNLASNGSNTTGSITGISGFTSLNVNSGTWTMSDNESFSGGESIAGGATLVLGAAGSTSTVNFANATTAATLSLSSAAQPASGGTFGGTLNGFGGNNILDLQGFGPTGVAATLSGNTLTVSNGTVSELFTLANPTSTTYTTMSDNKGGTFVESMVCFASGTAIRTERGDVPVEDLAVGDLVITASGAARPIRWLGHRTVDCRRLARPQDALPIRISAHAFGQDEPARDLFVSPGHAICVDVLDEVLIPAFALVNGATIQQVEVDEVTYWHVELEGGHEVILADNLACESYLDMGNRGFFAESEVVALDASPDADAVQRTHADFCRPFHMGGRLVEVVRAQLSARARTLGWRIEAQGLNGLHLLVDGVRIAPQLRGFVARFAIPVAARDVWLVSPTSIPAAVVDSPDLRALGACLKGLDVDDGFGVCQTIALDDPRLCVGFHPVERDGAAAWRWTAGRARLPASLWADPSNENSGNEDLQSEASESNVFLRVRLAGPMLPLWVAPAPARSELPIALAG